MYKINFHRDFDANQRQARRGAVWRTLVFCALALQLAMLGVLGLSNLLLEEQAQTIEESLPRLRAQITEQGVEVVGPDVDTARALLQIRSRRIDWSPKLSAIVTNIDGSMRLDQVEGRTSAPRVSAELKLSGDAGQSSEALKTLTTFVEQLRASEFLSDLPDVELGSLEGDRGGRFQVTCLPGGGS